jgi:RNA polymerase sigma factor (sigma-70 family)
MEAPPTTSRNVTGVLQDPGQRTRLLALARTRYGIGIEDARDLLQETAADLLRQRDYLVESPRAYVAGAFRIRCSRFLRARRQIDDLIEPEEAALNLERSGEPEASERRFAVRQAFGLISPPCRKLLSAYYVEGQSLREAAETMALAYSGVSKTLNRCLRRLRQCLN